MDSGIICPCCGQKSNGEFCMHCGEIIKHQRLSLCTLINSVPDVFFDVESGLFYSILNLLKRPGTVVRRYFAGDRSRNYKPLKFVLFIGGLWALLYIRFHIQGDSSSFYEQIFNDAKTGRNTGKNMDQFSVLVAKLVHVFAGISSGFGIVKNLLVKRTGITLNVKPDIQQRP